MANLCVRGLSLFVSCAAPFACQPAPAPRAAVEPIATTVDRPRAPSAPTAADPLASALGVTLRVPAGWSAEGTELTHAWHGSEADSLSIARIPVPTSEAFEALTDNARTVAITEGWSVEELPAPLAAAGSIFRRMTKPAVSRPALRSIVWFTTTGAPRLMFSCEVHGSPPALEPGECGDVYASLSMQRSAPPAAAGRRRVRLGQLSAAIDARWAATLESPEAGLVNYRSPEGAERTINVGISELIEGRFVTLEAARTQLVAEGYEVLRAEPRPISGAPGVFAESVRPERRAPALVLQARYAWRGGDYVVISCVSPAGEAASEARCLDRLVSASIAAAPPSQ